MSSLKPRNNKQHDLGRDETRWNKLWTGKIDANELSSFTDVNISNTFQLTLPATQSQQSLVINVNNELRDLINNKTNLMNISNDYVYQTPGVAVDSMVGQSDIQADYSADLTNFMTYKEIQFGYQNGTNAYENLTITLPDPSTNIGKMLLIKITRKDGDTSPSDAWKTTSNTPPYVPIIKFITSDNTNIINCGLINTRGDAIVNVQNSPISLDASYLNKTLFIFAKSDTTWEILSPK